MNRPLAAAVLTFALVGPGMSAEAAPPTVRGTTVASAATTAKIVVYVPTRTRVTATVEGTGRMVGAILRERHAQPDEAGFLRVLGRVDAWGTEVRKGAYDLRVLTDGKPVRVTFRFAKLSGTTTLTATGAVAWGTAPLRTSVGAPVAWSAGTSVRTPGTADLFTVASWKQDESLVAQTGGCSYYGSDGIAALGTYNWLPGCPLGTSGGWSEVRNPTSPPGPTVRGGAHVSVGRHIDAPRGTHGLGFWVQAQNVRDTTGFAYWLGG